MTDTDDRLFQLSERFEQHLIDEDIRFDKLIEAQQVNTESISELTISVASVINGTKSIIQLHEDFQGTIRIGNGVQKFLLWCLKWGAIGTGVAAIIKWLVEHFGK